MKNLIITAALGAAMMTSCVSNQEDPIVIDWGYGTHSESGRRSAEIPDNVDTDFEVTDPTFISDDDGGAYHEQDLQDISDDDVIDAPVLQQEVESIAPEAEPAPSGPIPRKLPKQTIHQKNAAVNGVFYVKSRTANVRKSPSTRSAVVSKLSRGQKVVAVARKGSWVKIGHNQYILGTLLSQSAGR